jgi:hypothetical protein
MNVSGLGIAKDRLEVVSTLIECALNAARRDLPTKCVWNSIEGFFTTALPNMVMMVGGRLSLAQSLSEAHLHIDAAVIALSSVLEHIALTPTLGL